MSTYDIIYADPPWYYHERVQHGGTSVGFTSGASEFYPTLTPAELKDIDVKSISAKNSLLYMWTTGPQLDIALDVMKAWGFSYKTIAFVWDKVCVNPGAYTMSQTELVIVGKRGSIPKPRGIRNARQFVSQKRAGHSAKPHEVRRRIELMHPAQKKIELFARGTVPGWDVWGFEATNPVIIPALDKHLPQVP
jgi:N6-adenosine-specific RNA methylase IME4